MEETIIIARPKAAALIFGVDEAGRGPLAGPVVAGAVLLGANPPKGLDDSKKLSAQRRAALEAEIKASCRWGIGEASVEEIDSLNVFGATMLAMTTAVAALCEVLGEDPEEVLVDGNLTPAGRNQGWRWRARGIVGGDGIEPCISAASILAKEHRDRLMRRYAEAHPHYGWEHNAGYGTPEHLAALRQHGPTPTRMSATSPASASLSQEQIPASVSR